MIWLFIFDVLDKHNVQCDIFLLMPRVGPKLLWFGDNRTINSVWCLSWINYHILPSLSFWLILKWFLQDFQSVFDISCSDAAQYNDDWEGRGNEDLNLTIPILMQNQVPEGFETDHKLDVSIRPDEVSHENDVTKSKSYIAGQKIRSEQLQVTTSYNFVCDLTESQILQLATGCYFTL